MSRPLAGLLVAVLSHTAVAAEPWHGPAFSASPEAMLEAVKRLPAVESDAGIDMLLSEERYAVDAQGRWTRTTRWVFRLVDPDAVEAWSTIEASWSAWHQARPELRARVISPAGTVHTLDPATLKEEGEKDSDAAVFVDTRVLRGPLPAMEVGAIVEEEFVIRDTAPVFTSGDAGRLIVGNAYPIRKVRMELSAPASVPLRYEAEHLPVKAKETREEGRRVIRLEIDNLPKNPDIEPGAPPDAWRWPLIRYSTGATWADAAKEYARVVEAQLAGEDLKAFAKRAFGDRKFGSTQELVQAALDWIHAETRYASVAFGEAAIVPRTPSEVLTRKYGDCKDFATLMVGLLRARGVDAQVALLRTQWRDVDPSLPGMGIFDHAIVRVAGKPELWVDPTSRSRRAGELPSVDQGRWALIAAPSTTKLVRIPEAPADQNGGVYTRDVHLAENGPAKIAETRLTRGSVAEDYRGSHQPDDEKDAREFYEGYFTRLFGTKKLGAYSAEEVPGQGFRVTVSADGATSVTSTRGEVTLWMDVGVVLGDLPEPLKTAEDEEEEDEAETDDGEEAKSKKEKKKRVADLILRDPQSNTLRYRIHPPQDFVVRTLPESAVIPLGPETFTRTVTTEKDGTVVLSYTTTLRKRRYTAAEVERFRADYAELAETDKDQVAFEHRGNAHLAAGRVREAIAAYAESARAHPKEAFHHLQLARALLQVGLTEPARAAARTATEVEPQSAEAHQTLGWILQHDLVGRRFQKGFDLEGALAAYRRAKELKPSFEILGDYAILLEHNASGDRYGKGARLEEALVAYRELAAKYPEETGLSQNVLFTLMWAGRYDELAKEASALKKGEKRDLLRVVAAAGARGGQAGIDEAAKIARTADARRKLLAGAAELLVLTRTYPAAVAVLKAAIAGAPNSAELSARVRLLEKLKRHEEVDLTADDPKTTVRRMLVAYLRPELTEAELKPLLSKRLQAAFQPAMLKTIQSTVARERRAVAGSGMRNEHLADFILAASELSAQGDEKAGMIVRQQVPVAGTPGSVFYLVREDRAWRMAGVSASPQSLALESFAAAQKGQLAVAEPQLDWIREHVLCDRASTPLAAFCALWPARPAARTLNDAKLASAAAMLVSEAPAEAISLMEAHRKGASPELARKLDFALAAAYRTTDRKDDFDAATRRVYEADPSDPTGLTQRISALQWLERLDALEALAKARLLANADDETALNALMISHLHRGDYDRGVEVGEKLAKSGRAVANTYNELAWAALFGGAAVDERALDYAHKAVDLTKKQNYAYLHTLATVVAERGDTAEALDVLKTAMALHGEEPQPSDWYVVARVCDHYGLTDAARAGYARARGPANKVEPFSTSLLAQRREKALPSAATATPAPP